MDHSTGDESRPGLADSLAFCLLDNEVLPGHATCCKTKDRYEKRNPAKNRRILSVLRVENGLGLWLAAELITKTRDTFSPDGPLLTEKKC